MNLNQRLNGIFCLLLITVSFLFVLTFMLFVYQTNDLKGLMNNTSIQNNDSTKNVIKKNETEENSTYNFDQYCKEFNDELLADSYLLRDKKYDKDIVRLSTNSSVYNLEEVFVYHDNNSCDNINRVVGANNIVHWQNQLIYTLLKGTSDCGEEYCKPIRQIFSYNLETGEENILWEGTMVEVPIYDIEGNLTEEVIEQGFYLMHDFKLLDDYLYLRIHSAGGCYACGYAPWGGFTVRFDLNKQPLSMEFVTENPYLGGAIEEHDGKYYIVNGACTEGGCGSTSVDLYDIAKNQKTEIIKFGEPFIVTGIIGFWQNNLFVTSTDSLWWNEGEGNLSIYKINLLNGTAKLFLEKFDASYEQSYFDEIQIANDYLVFINQPSKTEMFTNGPLITIYDLKTGKQLSSFEMEQGYRFKYMEQDDYWNGNHYDIFAALKEIGFDYENKSMVENYTLMRPSSVSDLFKIYYDQE